MRLEARKYLFDIAKATDLLQQFTGGKGFDDYGSDPLLRWGVERQFEIVGEALAQLRRLDESMLTSVTDYQHIIAFRNILIHGYADVDDRLVWDILQTRLETLQTEIRRLIESD